MKNTNICAALLALMLSLTACGGTESSRAESKNAGAEDIISPQETAYEQQRMTEESTESTDETSVTEGASQKKAAHEAIGFNGAKAVTDVVLIPYEDVDISRMVRFEDLYGIHVLHTGVVGLVGAPVEVDFDKREVNGGKLVFVYDPNELNGVRPDALMFMWYDEYNGSYVELEDGVLNTENCSMTIGIDKPGVYLLVNKYEWFNCWGAKLEDNGLEEGYDPYSEPTSSSLWEKNECTGDILTLKDDGYIDSCRQENNDYIFPVSTPEQLASAVYVNNCAEPRSHITIELQNDIDLDGYEWASMGWGTAGIEYDFTGTVLGNGHTISNMNIKDGYHVGFLGFATDAVVSDLHFVNARIGGRDIGILAGYPRGCIFTNCSAQGTCDGSDAGTLIGYDQNNKMKDCTADVIVNGESMEGYLSYTEIKTDIIIRDNPLTETIWLDDNDCPTREAGLENKYENLGWRITHNGEVVLERLDEGETTFDWHTFFSDPGEYEVLLYAWLTSDTGEGGYAPISNTVTFTVE